MNKKLFLGIVGLGTVGSGVIKSLELNSETFKRKYGMEYEILGVSASDKNKSRSIKIDHYPWFDDPLSIPDIEKINVIIELVGGEDGIAYDLSIKSLKKNKNLITANKALISKHGKELAKIADESNLFVGYEASVAGGIPVIKTLREGLLINKVDKVFSILNGTSNYILSTMNETNRDFEEVLGEAQELGYAESDPTLDINGYDSAHKLSIINALIFSEFPKVSDINIKGIEKIKLIDHNYANEFGYNIRLIATSSLEEHKFYKEVSPMLVKESSSLGKINGAQNIIFLHNNENGNLILEGEGAGAGPTSSAVISDLVDCYLGTKLKFFGESYENLSLGSSTLDAKERCYYFRVFLSDQKGAMAELTSLLSKNNISIDKIIQKGDTHLADEKSSTPVVMMTYPVSIGVIESVVAEISGTDLISMEPIFLPILKEV